MCDEDFRLKDGYVRVESKNHELNDRCDSNLDVREWKSFDVADAVVSS